MYESGVDSEEAVNYNLLVCHACLSFNRKLSSVGDYIDIYLKICDNSRMNLTSQINICWECLALLHKVQAFRRKVESAQKILEYCIDKQAPLLDNLSGLTLSGTETYTITNSITNHEDTDDNYHERPDIITEDYSFNSTFKDAQTQDNDETLYGAYPVPSVESMDGNDQSTDRIAEDSLDSTNFEIDGTNELMFRIENVRGMCDILDVCPAKSTPCEMPAQEPKDSVEEELRHRRWKRSVLLVYKRICGHRYARFFMRPVSDELAPQYSSIVRRPTDLSTIKRRIEDGLITSTEEFTCALLLMFSNALMYNSSYHEIYSMALEFREETLRELSLLRAVESFGASQTAPTPVTRQRTMREHPVSTTSPAKLTHRRITTWDEKPATKSAAKLSRRRTTMWVEQPESIKTTSVVKLNRRTSMWEEKESIQPAKLRGRRKTTVEEKPLAKPAAKLSRRRTTMWVEQPESIKTMSAVKSKEKPESIKPPAKLRGRRKTTVEEKPLAKPAAKLSRRRTTMWVEQPESVKSPEKLTNRRTTEASVAKPPAKLTRRRNTMWEPATKPPELKSKGTRDTEPVTTEPGKLRRRTTMCEKAVPTEVPAKLGRRRATVKEIEQDVIKPPKSRRLSLWSHEPIAPMESIHPPPHKWNWSGLYNDKYLVANCFKKYKGIVPL